MSEVHYSQHGQDKWLDENVFHGKRNGTFVEIGALNGIIDSNSLFFERFRDWTGLLVEANPDLEKNIRESRPTAKVAIVAVYDNVGSVDYQVADPLGWSGIVKEFPPEHLSRLGQASIRTVACAPLAQVLIDMDVPTVDYMSVDVEGAEAAIFREFPFTLFNIYVIGVENSYGRADLGEIFLAAGYKNIGRVGYDDFYRRDA